MRFDPFVWQELEPAKKYQTAKGALHVKASKPVAVFVAAEGVEALVGTGTDVRATFAENVEYWIEGEDGVRAFVYSPGKHFFRPVGEVYTNADRMPDESGSVMEVRKAIRQLKLEQREMRRKVAESERRRSRVDKPEPAQETAEDVDPPGDPDDKDTKSDAKASNQDDKSKAKAKDNDAE
jgi:hypothetical protein